MAQIFWEQILNKLPEQGEHLTGSLLISGTLEATDTLRGEKITGSFFDLDITEDSEKPPHKPGRVYFDKENGALTVYNEEEDIDLQVGQEFWIRVFNGTQSKIDNGTPVKIIGAQGDKVKIIPAFSEDHSINGPFYNNHILGVTTHNIPPRSEGYITRYGTVRRVNTLEFEEGDLLYLQTGSATFRNTPPEHPYDIIQVGYVTRVSSTNGFIFVNITEPVHTGTINGFSNNNPNTGDIWIYQSNNEWAPSKNLTGSYSLINGNLNINHTLLTGSLSTNVSIGDEILAVIPKDLYSSLIIEYVINKQTNIRSGNITAIHNNSTLEYTDTPTQNIGNTSDTTISVELVQDLIQIKSSTTSEDWNIKIFIKAL